ncbi:site-specific integrase [Caballeronia sp. AZ10_KS36]|uniref:site-specific integrase n=1 Tax=Caballeronia sp. AZ10_KS36 TaxID=2921757 RepID=UPI002028D880|nr:site-specific integrase [Caballeronia sp. AZ10_KS36]
MKPVKKCPYVRQRPGSLVFHFRMKIPLDLRDHYRKPSGEFSFSLRTCDLTEANRLAVEHAARYEQEFAALRHAKQPRGVTYLTPLNADALASTLASGIHAAILQLDDHVRTEGFAKSEVARALGVSSLRIGPEPTPTEIFDGWSSNIDKALAAARKAYAIGDSHLIDAQLDTWMREHNVIANRDSDEYQKLRRTFLTEYMQALEGQQKRNQGHRVDSPAVPSELRELGREVHAGLEEEDLGATLDSLLEAWEAERGGNGKTRQSVRSAFEEFKGITRQSRAKAVTKAVAVAYKDELLTKVSAATVEKKLGFIRAVFNLAEDNSRIDSNPLKGVKVSMPKNRQKSRVQFEAEDLRLMFSQPLFVSKVLPGGRQAGGIAAYWIPLVGLFTGARLEEIGQLHVADIKQRDGIWFIDINNEADKSVKNAPSVREVPIHAELLRLGFLEYVQSLPPGGMVFPLLYRASDGKLTNNFSKWFGKWKRAVGITDERKTFHSFRHGFATACRAAEVPTGTQYGITGHTDGSVGGTYGVVPLNAKAAAMRRISFDGLPELR